ncbi:MAG TPA: S-layer homology domain-containing protein [Oscillatoriales cyanobacterium M59_W2019_021]|nr:S-layer homology domain-containing protein [Oscillatoriales cyanobacterium M4454_W2019_049]HIK50964.1 S-layer homology domain-containing protein [Oscillatoriales cyanobacterium M59_W2019_021]
MTFATKIFAVLVAAASTATSADTIGLGAASKVSKLARNFCQEAQENPAASQKEANACTCYSQSAAPPEIQPLEASQDPKTFKDLQDRWEKPYIEALSERGIVSGFKDDTFRPDNELTWAEFAALLEKSFPNSCAHQLDNLHSLPASHWARQAISEGLPPSPTGIGKTNTHPEFDPNRPMSRVQVVVALVKEMNLAATPEMIKAAKVWFKDADRIPEYAKESVAIAVANRLIVPDAKDPQLYPHHVATRADVAALIYKTLVSSGAMLPVEEDLPEIATAAPIPTPEVQPTEEGTAEESPAAAEPVEPTPVTSIADLFANPDAPGVIAIGMAEGTRTVDGRPTRAYWGHTDPGNGARNLGSFSYQHGARSPQEADLLQLQRLYPHINALQATAEAYGMQLSVMELIAGVDLANQAPLATPHYIGLLKQAHDLGYDEMQSILEARAHSYINPDTQQLEAGGFRNDWYRLRTDQARRLAAMYYTLQAYGVVN